MEGIQNLAKCSVEYYPSKSVNEVESEENLDTLLSDEDNLFKVVAWQKTEVKPQDKEHPMSHSDTTAFKNTLADNLFCALCEIYLLDDDDYKKHKEGHRDKNEGPYKCEKCDSGFYEKTRLMHHSNNHLDTSLRKQIIVPKRDPTGFFNCTVCKFPFNRLTNYKRHYQRLHIQT